MSINIKAFYLTLMVFIASITLYAQSLSDIQNVKVDQLSDAQIATIVQKAEEQGISKSQIPALAEERGLPAMEASKLASRINQFGGVTTGGGEGEGAFSSNGTNAGMQRGTGGMADGPTLLRPDTLTEHQRKIFGFKEGGDVLIGEVSTVNDDRTDNTFLDPIGRFSEIEEDEDPIHLLVSDYDKWFGTGTASAY